MKIEVVRRHVVTWPLCLIVLGSLGLSCFVLSVEIKVDRDMRIAIAQRDEAQAKLQAEHEFLDTHIVAPNGVIGLRK